MTDVKKLIKETNDYYYQERDKFNEGFRIKVHRSLSWLKKAQRLQELESDEADIAFVLLWISFNALYGSEISINELGAEENFGDRGGFKHFLNQLCEVDSENRIYNVIWGEYSQSIRLIVDNPYTYQTFWYMHSGQMSSDAMLELYENNKHQLQNALAHQNTPMVLGLLFDRLYTVRNQLVHGGATYGSRVNRSQINDGSRILLLLLPAMLQVCMEHYKEDWGEPVYPVVGQHH
ncbi:MAG: hypothetical protein IAB19_01305 [Proteobacteria bacterium]|uniref:Apea-like HEPN domain-containing protein n=1 Tax=Candidatus Avisuccinivibrio stercorigallinarum TaxID=2840704 RepID=A0A9D9D883_9GAMM|nr:hypothetical protein [Candidatus Avisuccinivibrio stercorigallinarum]